MGKLWTIWLFMPDYFLAEVRPRLFQYSLMVVLHFLAIFDIIEVSDSNTCTGVVEEVKIFRRAKIV